MKLQPINLQVNPDIRDLPLINSKMAKVPSFRAKRLRNGRKARQKV